MDVEVSKSGSELDSRISNLGQTTGKTLGTDLNLVAIRILTAQSGWHTVLDRDQVSKLRNLAIDEGKNFVLVRDVKGLEGKGSGEPKPFIERKLQFLSPEDASKVEEFLKATPDFSNVFLSDFNNTIGDYPMAKPVAGEPLFGWQVDSVEFSIKPLGNKREP